MKSSLLMPRSSQVVEELLGELIAPLLRRKTVLGSGLLDLLAVLIQAGQEEDVVAHQAAVSCEGVGRHRGIRGPEVRDGVHVVDGGGEVERG